MELKPSRTTADSCGGEVHEKNSRLFTLGSETTHSYFERTT